MNKKSGKKATQNDSAKLAIRTPLLWPYGEKRVLLHVCCAPCSGEIIEAIVASGIELTLFFYNPNIYPVTEYEKRKIEIIRFALKKGVEVVDADYDPDKWFDRIKGLEDEPERGRRCTVCFDMRLERTALYAFENRFSVMSSALGISRWKDIQQVNDCGHRAVARYANLVYWDYNWRKSGGSQRMSKIRKREDFYQQDYCGCIFSLCDTRKRQQTKKVIDEDTGQSEMRGIV